MDTFHQSVWSSLTPPREPSAPLAADVDADVLICGGGFLGLSTALHLARSGVRVVLAEAEQIGFGASGRNTGFVVPSLKTMIGPDDVSARLGASHAQKLVSLVGDSGNILFDLVCDLSLDCSAEQTGWLQPAHSQAMLAVLERRASEWRRLGKDVEMLDRGQTATRLGRDVYHGSFFVPSGGQVNPLAYARTLADACFSAGVRIYEKTRILGFERAGQWLARTPSGSIRAERVVLATNGLVGKLVPEVNAGIIPARVFQIATQRYDAEVQNRILPGRSPVADTRRHTFAVRWSPDGRLLTGGIVVLGPRAMERARQKFCKRLRDFFPDIPAPRAEFSWTGTIAVTMDSYPRYFDVAPNMDAVIGCNGRGVALTTALGRELARHYTSGGKEGFTLPREKPKAIPMRRFAELGPSFWLPLSEFRDARESGASK
jgi:glycine/D-amino acid oxidase-like deaminating enzyme